MANPNAPNAADEIEALFAQMAASGRPILIGGPSHAIKMKDGNIVGMSKEPSLPDYVVEAALRHGAVDQRYSATELLVQSQKNGIAERIADQLKQLRASNEVEAKLEVVDGPRLN